MIKYTHIKKVAMLQLGSYIKKVAMLQLGSYIKKVAMLQLRTHNINGIFDFLVHVSK